MLLRECLGVHDEAHEDAKVIWTNLCNVKQYSDLDEEGHVTFKKLSQINDKELQGRDNIYRRARNPIVSDNPMIRQHIHLSHFTYRIVKE
jgi:hypothetical protein